jgi:hypothetical protein
MATSRGEPIILDQLIHYRLSAKVIIQLSSLASSQLNSVALWVQRERSPSPIPRLVLEFEPTERRS